MKVQKIIFVALCGIVLTKNVFAVETKPAIITHTEAGTICSDLAENTSTDDKLGVFIQCYMTLTKQ